MSKKRKLQDTDINDNTYKSQPQPKLRKIMNKSLSKKDKQKAIKIRDFNKLHLKVLNDLLPEYGEYKFKLIDDNIMKLKVEKNGKIFEINFETKKVRPNINSNDKNWLNNFTKQSFSSKTGICINEFTHGHNSMLFIRDKECLKLFYLNVMDHMINPKLFRGKKKPVGITSAKWKK